MCKHFQNSPKFKNGSRASSPANTSPVIEWFGRLIKRARINKAAAHTKTVPDTQLVRRFTERRPHFPVHSLIEGRRIWTKNRYRQRRWACSDQQIVEASGQQLKPFITDHSRRCFGHLAARRRVYCSIIMNVQFASLTFTLRLFIRSLIIFRAFCDQLKISII